jgi:tRNA-specific 2-thiouridylase
VLFPLGDLTKEEAREIARAKGLAVADKEASQEICFVASNYRDFIAKHVAAREAMAGVETAAVEAGLLAGPIVDAGGREVGRHAGLANFTVGQRKGLPALGRPHYVVALDPETRTVRLGSDHELWHHELLIENVNWVGADPESVRAAGAVSFGADVQIRSRHRASAAKVSFADGLLTVRFDEPQRAPTPGQSAVLYRGDEVVAGGIVTRVGSAARIGTASVAGS